MKTLYIDCGMGAAGDMLTAALLELFDNQEAVVDSLNAIGIPHVTYKTETVERCNIVGTHMHVFVDGVEEGEDHAHKHEHGSHGDHAHNHGHENHDAHAHNHGHENHDAHEHNHAHGCDDAHAHNHGAHSHHTHTSMHDVEEIIETLEAPAQVKADALAVYQLIAQAESHAHGKPVEDIHFHEVGTMDAIADVVAVCYLINQLAPKEIIASPVHVGSGQVRCAHGILPVPAPATAFILKDVPIYGGAIKSELCTPTGAAILKHFVSRFGDMPTLTVKAIGYGMGRKEFETANCVRMILGETTDIDDHVMELTCNLDDMTPEAIGFATELLAHEGALDVFTTPIGMKKNRPGVMLSVLCKKEDTQKMRDLIFKYTTTIGIRVSEWKRYTLQRENVTEQTKYGPVHKKITSGYGVTREKYEYDDLAEIARQHKLSIGDLQL